MPQEFVIRDESIKFEPAPNPLETSCFYVSESAWSRKFDGATKFESASAAIEVARKVHSFALPVKVLIVEREGNNIGIGEVKF